MKRKFILSGKGFEAKFIRSEHTLRGCVISSRLPDSSIGIATGWTVRVRFPTVQDLFLLHSVQTGCEAHLPSYPMNTGGKAVGA
jgi:hypothetical protein